MARKIQDITQAAQAHGWQACSPSSKATTSDVGKPSRSTIAMLFARMQVSFGNKWLAIVPDELTQNMAIAEWQHQLTGISEHEIAQGFQRLRKRPAGQREWPPGSIEFRLLCRPHKEPYERPEFQGNALPLKAADYATGRYYLDQIKGKLP